MMTVREEVDPIGDSAGIRCGHNDGSRLRCRKGGRGGMRSPYDVLLSANHKRTTASVGVSPIPIEPDPRVGVSSSDSDSK